eukprot:364831-Chlamydomonas_euryale.AAC.7
MQQGGMRASKPGNKYRQAGGQADRLAGRHADRQAGRRAASCRCRCNAPRSPSLNGRLAVAAVQQASRKEVAGALPLLAPSAALAQHGPPGTQRARPQLSCQLHRSSEGSSGV